MNKKLITIWSVLFLSFIALAFQYVEILKLEIVKAYDAAKPTNGHSWSEMQCTSDLCVKSGSGVGVGTDNPTDKLNVAGNVGVSGNLSSTGNISATGNVSVTGNIIADDVCNTDGACLSQISNFVSSQPLINNVHNYSACTTIGGEIISVGASYPICRFNSSSCPPYWSQYLNWSTTLAGSCSGLGYINGSSCGGSSCTTSFHGWSNVAREGCSYTIAETSGGSCWGQTPSSCLAGISQIGCY